MSNILKWAEEVKRTKHKNQSMTLLNNVSKKIYESVQNEEDSMDDCMKALCLFDPSAFDAFYRAYYPQMSEIAQKNWDIMFFKWADNCSNKKNSPSAMPRIRYIIQHKLTWIQSAESLLEELKWLSVHGDKRIEIYDGLRKKSKEENLRKLLSLDMNGWQAGQGEIYKMYSILFSESSDPETKKQYKDFLIRNGLVPERTPQNSLVGKVDKVSNPKEILKTKSNSSPKSEVQIENQFSPFDRNQVECQPQKESEKKKAILESATEEQKKNDRAEIQRKETTVKDSKDTATSQKKQAKVSENIEAPTEKLAEQIAEQKNKLIEQEVKIRALLSETEAMKAKIKAQTERITEWVTKCSELEKQTKSLNHELLAEKEKNQTLQSENEKDKSIIAQLHQMTDNSIRQELDGFKEKLRQAMASIVKDFREEYEENEKVEVYGALLEDLMYILKINDLLVEEK